MHISEIFRWIISIALGLFGWWLITMNFAIVYAWFVRRQHNSWIPLVGGFFALAGMGMCPLLQVRRFAWVPLVVDVAYFFSMLTIGLLMELHAWKKRRGTQRISRDSP